MIVCTVVFSVAMAPAAGAQPLGGNSNATSVGLTPLCDLDNGAYKGYTGALYPDGLNAPVGPYLAEGLYRAGLIRPLDRNGNPANDGTHPSPTSGVQKVAGLLLDFFTTDPTARPWFLARGALPRVHHRLR